jgi:NADP-dependent 3-hydroxy acid dehydrogenase YdfG
MTAGLKIVPLQSVYAGTKNAVLTISKGLGQEADDKLRATGISPGYAQTVFSVVPSSTEWRGHENRHDQKGATR